MHVNEIATADATRKPDVGYERFREQLLSQEMGIFRVLAKKEIL